MNSNRIGLCMAVALAVMAVPVLARHSASDTAQQIINLQNGSILYVFKDGKMAREDKYGRPTVLKRGEVLEAADGRKLTAVGNEVARLGFLLSDGPEN